jgi:hypothetical protein
MTTQEREKRIAIFFAGCIKRFDFANVTYNEAWEYFIQSEAYRSIPEADEPEPMPQQPDRDGWIQVGERTIGEGVDDLLVTDGVNVDIGWYDGDNFRCHHDIEPTHWMRLPDPPKTEKP